MYSDNYGFLVILEEVKMLARCRQGYNLFDDIFRADDIFSHLHVHGFDLDVKEEGDNFIVHADVPGVKKEDLSITLENGILTISAERKIEESQGFHMQERSYGKVSRSLKMLSDIDENSIDATLRDGVLKLVLSRAEQAKPRKIEIK